MSNTLFPIAVLISGGGTTLKNLIDRKAQNTLPVDFRLVVSSNPKAKGLDYAQESSIPTRVIRKKDFVDGQAHSDSMFKAIRDSGSKLVVMGGYLEHLLIPVDFEKRVINIHPSLIPAFCGKGMYGLYVHQAAIEFGVKVSGCTVHFVDNQYDHGPILLQRTCEVLDGDTPETLQRRVFELERDALPDAINKIAQAF
ncbi:MAG: phosphoribosylglycinamide formyltransferase [Planctomycetaceae bacterium]|nr:phosphoribosylglycinamide formyltransferase [Planctomycetaceae bacterium]MCE2812536.1 phosphoribosylglycinamide formyltransferase [Planctomycetaceae bacterium]